MYSLSFLNRSVWFSIYPPISPHSTVEFIPRFYSTFLFSDLVKNSERKFSFSNT
nr:MAG TPA: hypothetical protein [Caudoviricetes sp.]